MRRIVLLTAAMVMASTMSIAGLASSAGAATQSTHSMHGLVITGFMPAKKKSPPNVNIVTAGPAFSPTSVTGKKVSKAACKKGKKYSFSISNPTTSPQGVDWTSTVTGGAPSLWETIPADEAIGVCGTGKFSATPVFQLANNSSSVLTVTIT